MNMKVKRIFMNRSRMKTSGILSLGIFLEDGTTIIDLDHGSGELPSISIQIIFGKEFEPFITESNHQPGRFTLSIPEAVHQQLETSVSWSK